MTVGDAMSRTEVGVAISVGVGVNPEVGTGLNVSGIVAVKLTTTVEAACEGDIVSLVFLVILDGSVPEGDADEEATTIGLDVLVVSAADLLLIGAGAGACEVGGISEVSDGMLVETMLGVDELKVGVSVLFSCDVLSDVISGEEMVSDGSDVLMLE